MEKMEEVRIVSGYDPIKHAIDIVDVQGRAAKYLEVKYRKDWFLRWCKEHDSVGVLDDSEIAYNPVSKMVEGKATVFVNGNVIGRSSASKPYDPERMSEFSRTVFQDVGTIAMGRALANAGFGTVNCSLEEGNTTEDLADAPIQTPDSSVTEHELNPMLEILNISEVNVQMPKQSNCPDSKAMLADKNENVVNPLRELANVSMTTEETPKTEERPKKNFKLGFLTEPDIEPVTTVEDARKAIMPIGLKHGETLGKVFEENKYMIIFYAGKGATKFNKPEYKNFTRACQLILEAEGIK